MQKPDMYYGRILWKEMRAREHVLDLIGSGCGSVTCSCEHGNEFARSIKGGEFLSQLCNYDFVKDYALLSYVLWQKYCI
jgi:hypothetical protein